ncbi:hypothetical protein [Rhodococcus koreensis]|uniref:Uncharacterized protein n=2 Tax=Rhodococcus koreensis TaxID=99653 RepID=A0A1H4M296_9NOCA|nr:hypothetical protein [Rhodococcus koreensis]SEB77086.1 hypothetical protein SAMN04490239_1590 [Rhodococcus koreensis]
MAKQPKYGNTRFRDQLAFWIILPSFAGILAISVLMVIYAAPDNREEVARLVFSAVLPLFGTWVGTVLAFYFARDNFEAASESTLRLTGLLNRSSAVAELMIPRSQMVVHTLA